MGNTLLLVVDLIFNLICMLFWARFLLQASGADFYNPISQAVVSATDTILKPIRKILPRTGHFDIASLLFAWLIAMVKVALLFWIRGGEQFPIVPIMFAGLIEALLVLTQFLIFAILIMVIASFIAPGTYNPALALLNQLLEPIMGPVRRIMPTLGPLDLSPMVVMIILFVIQSLLRDIG